MKNRIAYIIYLLAISFITNSCVEPFDFETISFENALVIETTITNEFKYQEINLTRTFQFEEDAPLAETNADVKIIDDLQNTYIFEEIIPGKYISVSEFSAEPNRIYELTITTQNGSNYTSQPTELPQITQVDNLMAIREVNADGMDGVTIYANSFDPTGNSRYYRYEFEETYQIIPPFASSSVDVVILSDVPPFSIDNSVTTEPKTENVRVCYNTIENNNILQTQTTGLVEDRVSSFPVHFITSDNSIIRDRYSVLVKQYVQSIEAYTYYNILNELSGSESLLSQNQPGFINGNISSSENSNEKVLGFFEIVSVSSKRLFFNFRDLFPDELKPLYFSTCTLDSPRLVDEDNANISPLINRIRSEGIRHLETNFDFFGNINTVTPYVMVNRPCGDCTVFGTNIKPDFWLD